MRNKLLNNFIFAFIIISIFLTGYGCGSNLSNDGRVIIKFSSDGTAVDVRAVQKMVDAYNDSQGILDGVKVQYTVRPTEGYSNFIEQTTAGSSAPDVMTVNDRYFKKWTKMNILAPLDEYLTDSKVNLSSMWESGVKRYRYNKENNTSNDTDPLYGLLKDVSPTIIYYNETAFNNLGIKIISAKENEITEEFVQNFNNENKTNLRKQDLSRGFYREFDVISNGSWMQYIPGEVMVFNNKIPMSWDEVEDLGRLMTYVWNNQSSTDFGYYTWWWFYYGFSVGGDCIEDVSGNGDWVFTLGDDTPNYIVKDDFQGELTLLNGSKYKAGEIIRYNDKIDLTLELQNSLLANGSALTAQNIKSEIANLVGDTLNVLPSEKQAFSRYVMLAQKKGTTDPSAPNLQGLSISPIPSDVTITGDTGMFISQKVAMLVHKSNALLEISDTIEASVNKFDWDVAPLPIYKEYNDDGTVKAHGIQSGASDSTCYAIWSKSRNKDLAFKFISFMSSENAQKIQAEMGYTIPNQLNASNLYINTLKDKNASIIVDAAKYQTPGDWWYMPDKSWIDDTWANALNNQVRNQKMSLSQFFNIYIKEGNTALQKYKK